MAWRGEGRGGWEGRGGGRDIDRQQNTWSYIYLGIAGVKGESTAQRIEGLLSLSHLVSSQREHMHMYTEHTVCVPPYRGDLEWPEGQDHLDYDCREGHSLI